MKLLEIIKKDSCLLILISLTLFLILFPLSNEINFMQNDDWVYYRMVGSFLDGNFKLESVSAPTFYTQGVLGALFSIIFGIERLPILTLFISVLNFYIFSLIVLKFFKRSFLESVLFGLIFFFNPIHMYSIWGFMTENYFLFFLLLSFYFFFEFNETKKRKYIVLSFIFIILGFFLRQVALVIPLTFGIYYLVKREFKLGGYSFILFSLLFGFYQYIFPQTNEMMQKSFYFGHFGVNHSIFSMVYGVFIVLVSITLPVVLFSIDYRELLKDKTRLVMLVVLSVGMYLFLNTYFRAETTSLIEFPYFGNVWEQKGFFPENLGGTKYHFMGMYDLYLYWDVFSKIVLSVFVSYVVMFKRRKLVSVYSIFFIVYLSLMSLTEFFYDRYILVLVPMFLLFLLSLGFRYTKLSKISLFIFILFLMFYSYQFSMDYVLVNKYVWDKGMSLDVGRRMVQGTNAWKMKFRNLERDYVYDFSWDREELLSEEYSCCYELEEEKEIDYPLNMFVNSNVYLYSLR